MNTSAPVEPERTTAPSTADPYVGPRAFRIGERLHGRDREARELLDALLTERILLCHAPSGAGKTSLIQALLVPRLKEMEFQVLGPTRVGSEPDPDVPPGSTNRYVLSTLIGWEASRSDAESPSQLTSLTLNDYLTHRLSPEGQPAVLIFDQFEEVLRVDDLDIEAKKEFFIQLGFALQPRNRWALFAIREEYVAALDPYVHVIPTRLAARYPLELLGVESASEAIALPAAEAGVPFKEEAVAQLVDNLRRAPREGSPEGVLGRFVDPVQLQVVCTRLWKRLRPGTQEIGPELVGGVEEVVSALSEYYSETVQRVAAETDTSERAIRRWCEEALISGNARVQVGYGSEARYGLGKAVVKALVDSYLVRTEDRQTGMWYELAHDSLVGPVKIDNARWFAENEHPYLLRANLWQAAGRPPDTLVAGQTLKNMVGWAAAHPDENTPVLQAFLNESSSVAARRRSVALVGTVLGTALVAALLALAFTIVRAQAAERGKVRIEVANAILRDSLEVLRTRSRALSQAWGLDLSEQSAATVSRSIQADSLLQQSLQTGPAIRTGVRVRYYLRSQDSDNVAAALGSLGFPLDSTGSYLRNARTNAIAFGPGVDAESLKRVALALIRADVQLRQICPSVRDTASLVIQVIAVPALEGIAPLTLEQIANFTDNQKAINCGPLPNNLVYLHFRETSVGDRERMEGLRLTLQRAGLYAPGVQRVTRNFDPNVRYFYPADKQLADSVASITRRGLGLEELHSVFVGGQRNARTGQVEVWVELRSRRPRELPPR